MTNAPTPMPQEPAREQESTGQYQFGEQPQMNGATAGMSPRAVAMGAAGLAAAFGIGTWMINRMRRPKPVSERAMEIAGKGATRGAEMAADAASRGAKMANEAATEAKKRWGR